jgi:hypothetical protein
MVTSLYMKRCQFKIRHLFIDWEAKFKILKIYVNNKTFENTWKIKMQLRFEHVIIIFYIVHGFTKAQITIKVTTPFLIYFACINMNFLPKAKIHKISKSLPQNWRVLMLHDLFTIPWKHNKMSWTRNFG